MTANPYQVTVDILSAIDTRVNSGTATAQDLSYMAAGVAALSGASDLQTIVAGMLSVSTTAVNTAAAAVSTALTGVPSTLTGISGVLAARLNAFGSGASIRALPSTHGLAVYSGAVNGNYASLTATQTFMRPYCIDLRNNRTFIASQVTAGGTSNGMTPKTEFGYFDPGYNWNVLQAQANASALAISSATLSYQDCDFVVPLMNSGGTTLAVARVNFPGTSVSSQTPVVSPYTTGLQSSLNWPFAVVGAAGTYSRALVYDVTLKCLYAHNNTNAIKIFWDTTATDSGIMASGAWTQSAWSAAFGNRSRYIDLSGDIEAARTGDKYLPGGLMFSWSAAAQTSYYLNGGNFAGDSLCAITGSNGSISYQATPIAAFQGNYAANSGYIGAGASAPFPNITQNSKSIPFFVIDASGNVTIWRFGMTPKYNVSIHSYSPATPPSVPYAFGYVEGWYWTVHDMTLVTKASGFLLARESISVGANAGSYTTSWNANAVDAQMYFVDPFNGFAGTRTSTINYDTGSPYQFYAGTHGSIAKL